MPYTDVTEVREALAPGGDNDPSTAASLSDEDLTSAIEDVSSEIDSRLAGRYGVPFPGTPPSMIANLATDMAAYLATLTHRRGVPVDVNDPVRLRYVRAQSLLDQLSKGQAELIGVSGEIASAPDATVVNMADGELFDRRDSGIVTLPNGRTVWAGDPWYPGSGYPFGY